MRRHGKSEVALLLQEARAVELLANEAEIDPAKLQQYWQLSTDLITLVVDVEQLQQSRPDVGYDEPELLALRRRLRDITSGLAEMSAE